MLDCFAILEAVWLTDNKRSLMNRVRYNSHLSKVSNSLQFLSLVSWSSFAYACLRAARDYLCLSTAPLAKPSVHSHHVALRAARADVHAAPGVSLGSLHHPGSGLGRAILAIILC